MAGSLTLSQLLGEVKGFMNDREDITDSRRIIALNLCQEHIAQVYDPEDLELEVSENLPYTGDPDADSVVDYKTLFDVDIRQVYSFRVTDGEQDYGKLQGWSTREFDRRFPDPGDLTEDRPLHYAKFGKKFVLAPAPNLQFKATLRCKIWPKKFVEGELSAVSDLTGKDYLLINWAVAYLYDSLGEYERGKRFRGIFFALARDYNLTQDEPRPDTEVFSAAAVGEEPVIPSDYWLNPWVDGER